MKLKTLVSAVLVATTGSASAALLVDGFSPGKPSDVLVVISDGSTDTDSSGKTFLFNTRLKYSEFANGTIGSKSIDLSNDPNFKALKVTGAKLKFNIVGGYSLADNYSNYDKTGSSGKPFTDAAGTQWGVVTTGKKATDFNGEFTNLGDTTKNRIFAYWGAANIKLTAAGATATGGTDSVLVPKGDRQASFDLAWGGNFGGGGTASTPTANLGSPGETIKFFWVTNTDFDKGAVIELGSWRLTEDGKLIYAGSGGGGGGGDNQPPVARAGNKQSADTGAEVILDGSGSSDPNGDPLTYNWTQTSGPNVNLTDADKAKARFKPTAAGNYGFKLTVNDGKASSDASVQVTVKDALPPGPSITLATPSTWQVGTSQRISFTSNLLKPSQKVTVQFSKNGGAKYSTLKTVTVKAGGFNWKPAKSHVTNQGVLRAFTVVKVGKVKTRYESVPVNAVVNPKPPKVKK